MIRRVASMPFMPGRRTSIEMTSGCDARHQAQRLLAGVDGARHAEARIRIERVDDQLAGDRRIFDDHDRDTFLMPQMICLMVLQQLVLVELLLDDVGVGAEPEALLAVLVVGARGHQDDRDAATAPGRSS